MSLQRGINCPDQYPGDAGYREVEPYTIGAGCAAHGHLGGAGGHPVSFQGLVYVRGTMRAAGTAVIHGAVVVSEGGDWGGGGFEVFYDPSVQPVIADDGNVHFRVASWRETAPPSG